MTNAEARMTKPDRGRQSSLVIRCWSFLRHWWVIGGSFVIHPRGRARAVVPRTPARVPPEFPRGGVGEAGRPGHARRVLHLRRRDEVARLVAAADRPRGGGSAGR